VKLLSVAQHVFNSSVDEFVGRVEASLADAAKYRCHGIHVKATPGGWITLTNFRIWAGADCGKSDDQKDVMTRRMLSMMYRVLKPILTQP
jgi:hypothetical protein